MLMRKMTENQIGEPQICSQTETYCHDYEPPHTWYTMYEEVLVQRDQTILDQKCLARMGGRGTEELPSSAVLIGRGAEYG